MATVVAGNDELQTALIDCVGRGIAGLRRPGR
jgi:hypothetical protein